MKTRSRRKAGFSLVETVLGATLTIFSLAGAIGVYLFGMTSWAIGESKIDQNTNVQSANKIVVNELKEAMSVSVHANGKSITYRKPVLNGAGNYTLPLVWDGVNRSFAVTANKLEMTTNGSIVVLCDNVLANDPKSPGGSKPMKPFTAGPGTITRSVTVMIAAKSPNGKKTATARSREVVYLRNVPQLVK